MDVNRNVHISSQMDMLLHIAILGLKSSQIINGGIAYRKRYLSHKKTAKSQVSQHICTYLPGPSLFAHTTHDPELPHDKTNEMACVPSEDSDQPGHPPSLISVFTVHSVGS